MFEKYTVTGNEHDPLFIFAHGAGADSNSEFMKDMAARIASEGICVVRFDFPYMIKRQEDGKRRPPDRAPKLIAAWQETINELNRPCVLGGKSMGGRIASIVANDESSQNSHEIDVLIKGCACLGYPFHPPGQPEKQRTSHLAELRKPLLIVQGTRDTMGTQEDVASYEIDSKIEFTWLEDGNHDLKPRKVSGKTHQEHMATTAKAVAEFVKKQLANKHQLKN